MRAAGWKKKRQKGSHEIWKDLATGRTLIIVNHRGTVSPGIVGQIKNQIPEAPPKW